MLEQPPIVQAQAQKLRLKPSLSWLHRTLRDAWFYVAAISLIFNLGHTFKPQLSIQIGETIPNQPAFTLFTLTNTGTWTLNNIDTKCIIFTGNTWITSQGNIFMPTTTSPEVGNPDIRSLRPTDIATQDCIMGGKISFTANPSFRIDIDSQYDWFFGHGDTVRHFDMRSFGGKFILVPDVESGVDVSLPPHS